MRRLFVLFAFSLTCASAHAVDQFQNYSGSCQQGGQIVTVNGIQSAQKIQQSYPACTVDVFIHGTITHASIFTDAAGAFPLANPFSATSAGAAVWYAANGRYDVQYSNGGIVTPFAISDITLCFGCSGGGGGGGNIVPGTAVGQLPVWSVSGAQYVPQNKAIYDVRDWATCDGIADATTTGPNGGVRAMLVAIGSQEATIRWIGSTTPSAHCRLENTVFGASISHDFSGGGALEMISSTTPVGGAVFVNGTSAECNGGGGGLLCNTANATNGSTTLSLTAGNTAVVSVQPYPGFTFKINTVTDNCGDIFYHVQQSLVNQPRNVGLWVASSLIGGTCTITANANGATTHIQVLVNQFSGMGPVVSPDGKGSCSNADTTTMTSGAASTTAGSLLFGYGGQPFTSETCTAGAGFTQPAGLAGQSTSGFACSEYQLSSAGGSVTANQTITSIPTGSWVYCMQPLKVGNATATILGGITDADLHQIFFNANGTSTQGAIDFTGNLVDFAVHPEWWGANTTATSTVNAAALQASIWAAFGNGPSAIRSNGSGLNIYNKVLKLTGNYSINAELQWYDVINFKVDCSGRINNGITQTAANLRIIDGQSIAYGAFYDCSWANSNTSTNAQIDLDYNGVTTVGDLRPQFIDFYNNSFLGNGVTDVGVLIAKSGGGAQGSNIYCYDCAAQSFTGAAWQAGGNGTGRNVGRFYAQNALAIGWYGGDIQGSPLYGIAGYGSGYLFAYGTTFENGYSTQTGFDVYNEAGQGPCQLNLVRSESRRLASCSSLDIHDSGTGDGQMQYPTPGSSAPVGTIMGGDLTGIGWDGRYYKVSINTNGFNGVGTPSAQIIASGGTATTISDTNQLVSGAVTIKTFTSAEVVTQAVTGSTGTLVGAVPASTGTITGSVTSGVFLAGETITQAVTAITATLFNAPSGTQSISANNFSGTADNSHIWTGGTSGATYTPTAVPTFSATTMLITAATGAPDNSHNWTGGTSGAVLVPTTAPTNQANYTVNGFNGMLMTLLGGTGKGCYGIVTSNTATAITFSAGLVTRFFQLSCPNPDNTSTYVVQPNWNNGTVVDDNTGGGCSPCMTMVSLNEDGIAGGLAGQNAQGVLDNVSVPGDMIKMAPNANTVLKNVQTTRNDWGDFAGGFSQLPQTNHDWDVYNVNSIGVTGVTFYQNWSYPFNGGGQRTFVGPFHRDLGTRVLTWSCAGTAGPACLDTWIGGRSDPNATTDTTRNILEFGGMLGRAAPFGTNLAGADTDITGGPSSGNANGGAINFWTSTPGGSGTTVNSGLKRWLVSAAGHFFAGLDNTYDIGATGANRPRNLYLSNSVNVQDPVPFGSMQTQASSACETTYGITTLGTGSTTTDTGLNCLPANSIIDAVVYRITTTITTSANFTIGDATIAARFCGTQSTLTAGTTATCFAQADQTGTSGPRQVSAAKVRVTLNANPGAGAIRLIVYYHTWTPPTS